MATNRTTNRTTRAAILRQCRAKLEGEMGERVEEHEVLEAMGLAFLRGNAAASTKAPVQIAISVCPTCKVRRQSDAGVEFASSPQTFERAACDAQWLGDIDGEQTRAVQDVTSARIQEGYRCTRGERRDRERHAARHGEPDHGCARTRRLRWIGGHPRTAVL